MFWRRRSLGRNWSIGELANPERGRTGIEDTKKRSNKTVTASDCVQNRLQPPFRTRKLTICPLLSTAALVLLSEVEAIAVPCWAANRRRSMMSQGHFSVAGPIRRGAGGALDLHPEPSSARRLPDGRLGTQIGPLRGGAVWVPGPC